MSERKIVSCRIEHPPADYLEALKQNFTQARVIATFDDGSTDTVFTYYDDELSFNESEMIGLTEEQARYLKFERDRQYLQS
jgi:hypothetical protein